MATALLTLLMYVILAKMAQHSAFVLWLYSQLSLCPALEEGAYSNRFFCVYMHMSG